MSRGLIRVASLGACALGGLLVFLQLLRSRRVRFGGSVTENTSRAVERGRVTKVVWRCSLSSSRPNKRAPGCASNVQIRAASDGFLGCYFGPHAIPWDQFRRVAFSRRPGSMLTAPRKSLGSLVSRFELSKSVGQFVWMRYALGAKGPEKVCW